MWYRNNIALGKNERYTIDNDNTLLLAKSRTIDGGSYSCRYLLFRVIHNYWYGNKRSFGGLRMVVQKIYVKVNFYTFIKASFNIK